MKSYIFKQILENSYILSDGKNEIELMLEFYPQIQILIGDKILMHEKLLDRNSKYYTQPYAFEITNFPNELVKEKNSSEYIVISSNNKMITLKRIYG